MSSEEDRKTATSIARELREFKAAMRDLEQARTDAAKPPVYDSPVAWLRAQVEADLAAARRIGAGGFEPQRWDTDPPGQVNPEADPVTGLVNAVLIPDPEDREFRECLPGWVQVVAYDRLLGEPPEADCRDDDLPLMLISYGRREFEHVIRHDPRNVVARCEAELAILDEHGGEHMCFENSHDGNTWAWYIGDCRVVRHLAGGYKHRPGYREEDWRQP